MAIEKRYVYGLSGFFIERHSSDKANYFGGFFFLRTDEHEPRRNVSSMPLGGLLVDCHGASKIVGEMTPAELLFDKTYVQSGNRIKYSLRKNNHGIWVGEYSAEEQIGNGAAFAKTN